MMMLMFSSSDVTVLHAKPPTVTAVVMRPSFQI